MLAVPAGYYTCSWPTQSAASTANGGGRWSCTAAARARPGAANLPLFLLRSCRVCNWQEANIVHLSLIAELTGAKQLSRRVPPAARALTWSRQCLGSCACRSTSCTALRSALCETLHQHPNQGRDATNLPLSHPNLCSYLRAPLPRRHSSGPGAQWSAEVACALHLAPRAGVVGVFGPLPSRDAAPVSAPRVAPTRQHRAL